MADGLVSCPAGAPVAPGGCDGRPSRLAAAAAVGPDVSFETVRVLHLIEQLFV
jgi:hypothetical protein